MYWITTQSPHTYVMWNWIKRFELFIKKKINVHIERAAVVCVIEINHNLNREREAHAECSRYVSPIYIVICFYNNIYDFFFLLIWITQFDWNTNQFNEDIFAFILLRWLIFCMGLRLILIYAYYIPLTMDMEAKLMPLNFSYVVLVKANVQGHLLGI